MPALRLEHLSYFYERPRRERVPAIQDLSLEVADGELLTILGPSGSGKTTLLRLVAGLEVPTSGKIWAGERMLNTLPAKERDIAMVPQAAALYPQMTAAENIRFGLQVRKVPAAESRARFTEAVDLLDLAGCLDRHPEQLSGGQRQRVALARALVLRPKIFLLDEPLSQLDTPLRAQLRAHIVRVQKHAQAAMLYVTHDQTEALALGARLAVLDSGQLQQTGSPAEIYRNPANLFVAGFLGWPGMNQVHGTLQRTGQSYVFVSGKASLSVPLGTSGPDKLAQSEGRRLTLGLRPEDIKLETPRSSSGQLEGTVISVQQFGPETHVSLVAGNENLLARLFSGTGLPDAGSRVRILIESAGIYLFDSDTGARVI